MRWYISQAGQTSGPFAEQRVAMLITWGKISRAAYICDEQSSCWVSITRSQFGALLAGEAELASSRAAVSEDVSRLGLTARVAPSTWSTMQQRFALAALILLSGTALLFALGRSPTPANERSAKSKATAHSLGSAP